MRMLPASFSFPESSELPLLQFSPQLSALHQSKIPCQHSLEAPLGMDLPPVHRAGLQPPRSLSHGLRNILSHILSIFIEQGIMLDYHNCMAILLKDGH